MRNACRASGVLVSVILLWMTPQAHADDECHCDVINAQSKARGLCTRTQMTASCLMVWNTADRQLADATNRAPATIAAEMPPGSSFAVTALKDVDPSAPPSQIATNNLNAVSPDDYSAAILPSYLTIAGGALSVADEGGFLKEAAPRALSVSDQILSALKGREPFQRNFGRYLFSVSLGCFKIAADGGRNVSVLIKTRFASVETCH
jgi:hypothetical protein